MPRSAVVDYPSVCFPTCVVSVLSRRRVFVQRPQCRSRLVTIVGLSALAAAARLMTTTSSPANNSWCWRKDSRIILFIRFRAVARRHNFLEIASPRRARSSSFRRQSTVNSSSRLRVAFSNTRPKAAAFSSRLGFWNWLLAPLVNPEL
jgi:hypothetical protein